MKIPLPKSFHHKISLWISQEEKGTTSNQEYEHKLNWLKKYGTYAHYLEGPNLVKIMNPLSFGSSIVNPYHIFQIRRLPNLSSQMRILKEKENAWFKIQNISPHSDTNRFLNIVTIPLPHFLVNQIGSETLYENI